MPRVASLLPIPRRYGAAGIRRYGFHGLSYEFLMEELARLGDPAATRRVILTHLGNGARPGRRARRQDIDASMGFTPASGLTMGTRVIWIRRGMVLDAERESDSQTIQQAHQS